MVNFAELKAKAEKAKDASITKVTNTRDRYSSMPSSKVNWDPNWKRASPAPATSSPRASTSGPPPPPPPLRSRADGVALSGTGTALLVPRASRQTDLGDSPAPPPYMPRPPPTRAASGYPPNRRETSQDAMSKIDWTDLSVEDKKAFFGWLDEFFSQYLGIEVGPRERRTAPPSLTQAATSTMHRLQPIRPPPSINLATRPQV